MVEGTRLESGRTLIAYREFESHPLRHEREAPVTDRRLVAYEASLGSLGVAGKLKSWYVASAEPVTRPTCSGP